MSNGCATISEPRATRSTPVVINSAPQSWTVWIASGSVILWCIICRSGFTLETYPWYFPDSYDWIVNGLAYAAPQVPFEISHRGLLFTLIMAALYRIGAPNLIALSGTLAFVLLLVVVARGLTRLGQRELAWTSVILLTFSHPPLAQSAFVGSDVFACIFLAGLTLSFLRFVRLRESRDLLVAAAWAGFGIHSQYIEVVWLPVLGLLVMVEDAPVQFRIKISNLYRLVSSRTLYVAIALGAACSLLLLIPRLILFETIYSARVTHLPLVSPNLANFRPYLFGLTGQIGLPIVLLASIGTISGLATAGQRLLTLGSILWTATIGGFFVFLYTWYDCRFSIYICIPLCILAAMGTLAVLNRLGSSLSISPERSQPFRTLAVIALGATQIVRPDTNMFSDKLMVIPGLSVSYSKETGLSVERGEWALSVWHALRDSRAQKALVASHTLETMGYSQNVADLFHRLKSIEGSEAPPPHYVDYLLPDQWYYVKNRNIIYFGSRVDSRSTASDAIRALRSGENGLTVGPESVLLKIFSSIPEDYIIARAGSYLAVNGRSLVEANLLRKLPAIVNDVEAPGDGYALFDEISNNAANYGSAPLGQPIIIHFAPNTTLKTLRLALFDFDGRRYGLVVSKVRDGQTSEIYHSPPSGDSGVVVIPVNDETVTELQIVGTFNSDTEKNPANTTLHIKEIYLE